MSKVHFAALMDFLSLQRRRIGINIPEVNGRDVLRGDIVKDDAGAYAVFTEQGASASQMTAAKVMGVIARRPDRDGQAADAVSVYTQGKMEDAHKLLRIPRSERPDLWIRIPQHR